MSSENTKKTHEYHLVDPSPWPLLASIGALIACVGAVVYFRTDDMWTMIIGLAIVVYVSYMWFRDVIIEGEHQGHHTPVVQIGLRYGMTLFIASEAVSYTHLTLPTTPYV